jgi:iron(III) transport system permease protein
MLFKSPLFSTDFLSIALRMMLPPAQSNLINLPFFRYRWQGWAIAIWGLALTMLTPILAVLSSLFSNTSTVWRHLTTTVLSDYVLSSLELMIGVGVCTGILGVSTAWLVTLCRFPGSRWLEWALLLPLAAPAYILAYVYTELLEFYGPVQSALRQWFGWSRVMDYWFPSIRSMPGAILLLSLVLYPYVYLLTRVAFLEQSVCTLEASRSLGCSPWRSFFRVALPLARPAIAAGLALVLMETLNDFATVQYFAVNTFSVGIYRTWFGMGQRLAACQLSALLLGFILLLIVIEQRSRRHIRYYRSGHQRLSPYQLKGWRAMAAIVFCSLPIGLGFLLPAARLLQLAIHQGMAEAGAASLEITSFPSRWQLAHHSLILAGTTAAIAVLLSLAMAYGVRLRSQGGMKWAVRLSTLGYAVPGTVIAVGVLFPVGGLDQAIDRWMRSTFNLSTGLLLSGTIAVLIFAYLVRFLAVAYQSVESSLNRVHPHLDDAAHSLGHGVGSTLLRVHAPLIRGGLLTAALLVFVDVMKELPATLIVRPFNFDTLAVEVYRLAADERLSAAAIPALTIVAMGIIPVLLLSWQIAAERSPQPEKPTISASINDTY